MEKLIRMGHSLNREEEQNVAKRRLTVLECLKKNQISCPTDKVPNIALIGSGGGERAMVALLGSLLQLKKENLLDSVTYLSGVSGSTWCMSSLYRESNWSSSLESMESITNDIAKRLAGPDVTWAESGAKLQKYFLENESNYNLTHFWSAVVVPTMLKEIDERVMSEQRGKCSKDPYPIFNVIDKDIKPNQHALKDMWLEMTPDEAGYSLSGGYVDQAYLGSKFDQGKLTKKHPEMDMAYVQGICGSALGDMEETKQQMWTMLKDAMKNWVHADVLCGCQPCEVFRTLVDINLQAAHDQDYTADAERINLLLQGNRAVSTYSLPVELDPSGGTEELKRFTQLVCEQYDGLFPVPCSVRVGGSGDWYTIIRRTIICLSSWTWGTTHNFLQNMPVQEVDSNGLAEVDSNVPAAKTTGETRDYIDAGLRLNSPYFSVLRKARNIDLIISLDFSAGDPMLTIEQAHKMAKEMDLPFPPVQIQPEPEGPKDFYVYPAENGCPTVIHMPLFNVANCGDQLEAVTKTYKTFQGPYSSDMISDLMAKAAENVKNNKDKLLKEIEKAMTKNA